MTRRRGISSYSVKVFIATALISAVTQKTQAWPFNRRSPGSVIFPASSVWTWEDPFADPRDLSGIGGVTGYEEFSKSMLTKIDGKLGPGLGHGFEKVRDSARKTATTAKTATAKPALRPAKTTLRNDKLIRTASPVQIKPLDDTLQVEIISPNATKHMKEDMVLFPDDVEIIPTERTNERQGVAPEKKVSFEAKPCDNDVLCDDTDDYPGEAILRSLRNNFEAVKEFFREEGDVSVRESLSLQRTASAVLSSANGQPDKIFSKLQESADIGTRRAPGAYPDPFDDERPLCTAESITRYPRKAKTDKDKWLLVVNHENYTQGVRIEKCQNEGSECFLGDQLAPLGYKSVCRQKYAYRKLLAITPDGRTIAETFQMPSCCTCHVKLVSPALRSKLRSPSPTPIGEADKTLPIPKQRSGRSGDELDEGST